ncbi:MAG TPA: Spy/CpxP family protein refolding chaperone [bacterium]|nr:Spy/CpxP family protein refolding chaperone [bacterium]
MNRRPILKITLVAGAASLIAALGGIAFAHGAAGRMGANRGAFMKKMVSAKIDDALDYAKVDDAQRTKIHEIRDNVFAEMEKNRPDPKAHMAQVKELFLADKIDTARVAELRAERQAKMEKMGDLIEKALIDAHDVLTPEQRAKVVEYAEKQHSRWHEED